MAEIKIASLNVDSIVGYNRRDELNSLIFTEKIDICLVQETKLDEKIKFRLCGYNILRNDFVRGRAGTAIYVRDTLPIRNHITYNDVFHSNSVDVFISNKWQTFSSVYFPPGLTGNILVFKKFFNKHRDSFMGGDFNSRHRSFGDISDNIYGLRLLDVVNSLNGHILNPPVPTHYGNLHGSFIDKFINFSLTIPASPVSVLASFSDHLAISILIPGVCDGAADSTKYDYDNTDFLGLNRFLEINIKRIVLPLRENISANQIDDVVTEFNRVVARAIDIFVPISRSHGNSRVILSSAIRTMQRHCKRLQRKLFRNNHSTWAFKSFIINSIRHLRTMIKNQTAQHTAKFFSDQFGSIQNTLEAHQIIKRFTGHRKRETMGGSVFTDVNKNESLCGSINIANALGRHFAANNNLNTNSTLHTTQIVDDGVEILNRCDTNIIFNEYVGPHLRSSADVTATNASLPPHQHHMLTCSEEVANTIRSRPNKKSTGYDGLPFTLIKEFSPTLVLFLTVLFNHCLAISHFPAGWKLARVTAIPKPNKDSGILTNWRPISQLCCVSKIFEKIISNRLNCTIGRLKLFDNQFGFLGQHSTTHALARIQDKINYGLNHGMITSLVAIDLKAAFDVLWHRGLIFKLTRLGFHPGLAKLIQGFLTGRTFSVALNGFTSDLFHMINGAPQGSVLSPTLFNLYLHDLPIDDKILTTQFADDITLHITHNNPPRAQNQINIYVCKLIEYFKNWKLLLSAEKSEFINILGRVNDTSLKLRKKARNMKITIGGLLQTHKKSIRLLGVQFQSNNTFVENIKIRLMKARRARFAIQKVLSNKYVDIRIKTGLYKTYLRSILTYAAPVWCQPPLVSAHQMELLRCFERSCLRNTANIKRDIGSYKHISLEDIYKTSNCDRVDRFISRLHVDFFEKCIKSRNKKFKYSIYNGSGVKYKPIYYIHKLHIKNRLYRNGDLLLFHTRFNRQPGLVYNTRQ